MNFYSAIIVPFALFLLSGSVALTPEVAVTAHHAPPGLSSVTPEKIYLASEITAADEEAAISDSDEQSTIGDPGE